MKKALIISLCMVLLFAKEVQTLLNQIGYNCGAVDGSAGKNTKTPYVMYLQIRSWRQLSALADGVLPIRLYRVRHAVMRGGFFLSSSKKQIFDKICVTPVDISVLLSCCTDYRTHIMEEYGCPGKDGSKGT